MFTESPLPHIFNSEFTESEYGEPTVFSKGDRFCQGIQFVTSEGCLEARGAAMLPTVPRMPLQNIKSSVLVVQKERAAWRVG